MNWADTDKTYCGVAAASELLADRWTMLVLRDVALGVRRYDEIQQSTGASSAVLADRLKRLAEDEILSKVRYQDEGRRHRYEYQLTERGMGVVLVQLALAQFGYDHLVPDGKELLRYTDRETGQPVRIGLVRDDGQPITLDALEVEVNEASQHP